MKASEEAGKATLKIATDWVKALEKERDDLQARVDSLVGTLKMIRWTKPHKVSIEAMRGVIDAAILKAKQ